MRGRFSPPMSVYFRPFFSWASFKYLRAGHRTAMFLITTQLEAPVSRNAVAVVTLAVALAGTEVAPPGAGVRRRSR